MRLETQISKNIANTTFKVSLESYKIEVSVCSLIGKPGSGFYGSMCYCILRV